MCKTGCGIFYKGAGCHSDLNSVFSSIRQSERREGESVGVCPNLCLTAIVLSPLVGYGGIIQIFSFRDPTSETVALSCSWNSFIAALSSDGESFKYNNKITDYDRDVKV